MKNKIRILVGILAIVALLIIGLTSAVFADPQDEDGSFGPGYCAGYCLGNSGGDYTVRPGYGSWSCH